VRVDVFKYNLATATDVVTGVKSTELFKVYTLNNVVNTSLESFMYILDDIFVVSTVKDIDLGLQVKLLTV
jgi:hypothetical protein